MIFAFVMAFLNSVVVIFSSVFRSLFLTLIDLKYVGIMTFFDVTIFSNSHKAMMSCVGLSVFIVRSLTVVNIFFDFRHVRLHALISQGVVTSYASLLLSSKDTLAHMVNLLGICASTALLEFIMTLNEGPLGVDICFTSILTLASSFMSRSAGMDDWNMGTHIVSDAGSSSFSRTLY